MSRFSVVLCTPDLRVHDNPAPRAAATEFERVVPFFVEDDAVRARRLLARRL